MTYYPCHSPLDQLPPALRAVCIQVNVDWVVHVTELLLSASEGGTNAAQEVLPHTTAQQILEALCEVVQKEPTVMDVST